MNLAGASFALCSVRRAASVNPRRPLVLLAFDIISVVVPDVVDEIKNIVLSQETCVRRICAE